MRKTHNWTDEERGLIRRYYSHTRKSRQFIAQMLGVTEYGVAGQISIMGLGKSDDRHPWTKKEEKLLQEIAHHYCPRRIARIMHRSINSVVLKMKRLHIRRRARDGWYTKREVCEILGHDHKWVQARIDREVLVASYHYETRPQKNGPCSWHIEEEDLIDFIKKFPQEMVGCNIDIITIVELLSGIGEPTKGRKIGRPKIIRQRKLSKELRLFRIHDKNHAHYEDSLLTLCGKGAKGKNRAPVVGEVSCFFCLHAMRRLHTRSYILPRKEVEIATTEDTGRTIERR